MREYASRKVTLIATAIAVVWGVAACDQPNGGNPTGSLEVPRITMTLKYDGASSVSAGSPIVGQVVGATSTKLALESDAGSLPFGGLTPGNYFVNGWLDKNDNGVQDFDASDGIDTHDEPGLSLPTVQVASDSDLDVYLGLSDYDPSATLWMDTYVEYQGAEEISTAVPVIVQYRGSTTYDYSAPAPIAGFVGSSIVPKDDYSLVAFVDLDADATLDSGEPRGRVSPFITSSSSGHSSETVTFTDSPDILDGGVFAPSASSPSGGTIDVSYKANLGYEYVSVDVYAVAVPTGDPAPSASQIKGGLDASGTAAPAASDTVSTPFGPQSLSIAGLTAGDYDVYLYIEETVSPSATGDSAVLTSIPVS